MAEMIICMICRDQLQNGVATCSVSSTPSLCKGCVVSYVNEKVHSAFMGSCPTMKCFCEHSTVTGQKHGMDFAVWKPMVSEVTQQRYVALANSLLPVLCGSCHTMKTLNISWTEEGSEAATKYLQDQVSDEDLRALIRSEIVSFDSGMFSVEDIYQTLVNKYFPAILLTGSDKEAWDCFQNVLRLIRDPERRANLHLRHLRSRPRMWTPCCNREHCFRCRTKDFHEGKTCDENTASLDQSVITCPACCVAIAKGDGCNTVTCVCGKQFSWSEEKEKQLQCQEFLARYPNNPSAMCAQLLCEPPIESEEIVTLARSWQKMHEVVVNEELLKLWKIKNPLCPSQVCILTQDSSGSPAGMKEAANLWATKYAASVEKCRASNRLSVQSLLPTMFPEESLLVMTAIQLLEGNCAWSQEYLKLGDSSRTYQSALLWREEHPAAYAIGLDEWERRRADQFLALYGSDVPHWGDNTKTTTRLFSPVEWDLVTSCHDLTFTNRKGTVERVGSVSCYPAAFAPLPSARSSFTVIIESCPYESNYLSFGIARIGFAKMGSDGVGRTSGSWGVMDDRSSVTSAGGNLYADRVRLDETSSWRKFREGDRLTVVVDTDNGWCELSLNNYEHRQRFSIPKDAYTTYTFAMTFATNHRVSIQQVESGTLLGPRHALNSDQREMFISLKKRMLKTLRGDPSIAKETVEVLAAKWEELALTRGQEGLDRLTAVAAKQLEVLIGIPLNLNHDDGAQNSGGSKVQVVKQAISSANNTGSNSGIITSRSTSSIINRPPVRGQTRNHHQAAHPTAQIPFRTGIVRGGSDAQFMQSIQLAAQSFKRPGTSTRTNTSTRTVTGTGSSPRAARAFCVREQRLSLTGSVSVSGSHPTAQLAQGRGLVQGRGSKVQSVRVPVPRVPVENAKPAATAQVPKGVKPAASATPHDLSKSPHGIDFTWRTLLCAACYISLHSTN